MVKIIFSRIGKKKQSYFRIIALDKKKDPWGKSLEILGNYDPRTKKLNVKIDRIKYWLKKGAQPSVTVHNLLVSHKLIEGKKMRVTTISKKRLAKINEKNKVNQQTATSGENTNIENPSENK